MHDNDDDNLNADTVPPTVHKDQYGKYQVSVGWAKQLTVECSANNKIIIDKLFGPLAAENVRIYLDYNAPDYKGEWVVERRRVDTLDEVWEEKARWSCQETFSDDDEPPSQ